MTKYRFNTCLAFQLHELHEQPDNLGKTQDLAMGPHQMQRQKREKNTEDAEVTEPVQVPSEKTACPTGSLGGLIVLLSFKTQ